MKKKVQIFSIILSFFIFFFSIWNCTLNVFAFPKFDWSDMTWKDASWEEVEGEIMALFGYASTSLYSITNGNFSQFMENYFDYKSLWDDSGWLKDQITVDTANNNLILSEDLTAYMKQALLDYAQEVNGFELIPTTDYHDLSASDFASGYVYHSFRNLVHEAGVLAVSGGGGNYGGVTNNGSYFNFFRPFDADSIKNSTSPGPVSLVKASGYNSPYWDKVIYYDTYSWNYFTYTTYECKTYYNNEEGLSVNKVVTSFDECLEITAGLNSEFKNVNSSYIGWDPTVYFSQFISGYHLYSTDGRKLKVFNSLNALKNYTAGERGVYFGSGFYDTPGEIKVSFDDLEKYIDGKYNDFFKDLKDLIGKETDNEDNLTEEDLEKLVDKILGSMNDSGNNDNPGGNTGDNSGILSDILSALSGYFDSVLAYLDSILTSIQGLIYVETVKPDPDDGYDLSDMINDVWEDPENGSQTVADSLSASFSDIGSVLMAKFPFCIPNDLYSLFNVFANIPESRAAPMSLEEDGIQTHAESGSAPRFELPLVIESFGVDEVIIIDMEPFTPLSKNARVFLSLIFAVALMKFSAVVIGFINDAWG